MQFNSTVLHCILCTNWKSTYVVGVISTGRGQRASTHYNLNTVTHTDTDKMLPSNLKLTTTYLFWYEAHQMFGSFFLAQISNESLRPISQIPQFIRQHPKMQHFVREMCTFLLQNCVLWDIGLVHCGTFAADLFTEEFIRIGKEREFRRWIKWIS